MRYITDNKFGGLKISFKGKVSLNQIIYDLSAQLLSLQNNFDIEEFSGVNFYFNMYKNDEKTALIHRSEDLPEINCISIESNKNHKTFENLEDGSKKVTYSKGIDFDNFKDGVYQIIKNSNINYGKFDLQTKSEIEARLNEIEKEKQLLLEKQRIQRKKEEEEEQRLRNIEQKKLLEFKNHIKATFNIKEENFNDNISSYAIIVSKSTITKYLKNVDNLKEFDDEYFRVTFINKKTGKAGDIYIYNMNKELVTKIKRT